MAGTRSVNSPTLETATRFERASFDVGNRRSSFELCARVPIALLGRADEVIE
jgi:hypothetical protein